MNRVARAMPDLSPSASLSAWPSVMAVSSTVWCAANASDSKMCRGICLHVRVIEGRNVHHIVEAQFKAVARALRAAAAPDPRAGGIPSTKGVLA